MYSIKPSGVNYYLYAGFEKIVEVRIKLTGRQPDVSCRKECVKPMRSILLGDLHKSAIKYQSFRLAKRNHPKLQRLSKRGLE